MVRARSAGLFRKISPTNDNLSLGEEDFLNKTYKKA
jgi:hypothetical protein